MPPPLAYFLTWTTYATWLHGDRRGSVSHMYNVPLTPTRPPDPALEDIATAALASTPYVLSGNARAIVDAAIRAHCDVRIWRLHALNVRTNHVHVVVECPPECAPEKAMNEFKAWSTRRLRAAGLLGDGARAWTRHGSTRWINTPDSLARAIEYVVNQ